MNADAADCGNRSHEPEQDGRWAFSPTAPTKLEDLDIPRSLVEDLMLRYLYTKGTSSIRELSHALKLSFSLLHDLFQQLRQKQLFEISGIRDLSNLLCTSRFVDFNT